MKTKKESDKRVIEAERKAKDSRQREEEAIRVSPHDFKIRETIMSKWSRHRDYITEPKIVFVVNTYKLGLVL